MKFAWWAILEENSNYHRVYIRACQIFKIYSWLNFCFRFSYVNIGFINIASSKLSLGLMLRLNFLLNIKKILSDLQMDVSNFKLFWPEKLWTMS